MIPQAQQIELVHGNRGPIKYKNNPSLTRNDEYIINISEKETLIESSTEQALFYAKKTLEQTSGVGYIHDYADLKMRIIMIDLKRIQWQQEYLLSLFEDFGKLKLNYCLIEYENTFPYKNDYGFSLPITYDVKKIELEAQKNYVEIIPLVQCLSHWEYILKEREDLRELPHILEQACPLKDETFNLFCKMAKEVVDAHPNSKYFHIGADEARFLGQCKACKNKEIKNLYEDYILKVVKFINSLGKTAIMWGDFFRHHDKLDRLKELDVILIDWAYDEKKLQINPVLFPKIETLLSFEKFEKLSEEQQNKYKNILNPNYENKTFYAFPNKNTIEQAGFRCLNGGNIRSVDNILTHCIDAKLGVIGTYWAASNSLAVPYTLYSTRQAGIKMLAAASWNKKYETKNRDTFYQRALNDDAKCFEFLDNFYHHFSSPKKIIVAPNIQGDSMEKFILKKLQLDNNMQQLFSTKLDFTCEAISIKNFCNMERDFSVNGIDYKFTSATFNHLPVGNTRWSGVEYFLEKEALLLGNILGDVVPNEIEIPLEGNVPMLSLIWGVVGGHHNPNDEYGTCQLLYKDKTSITIPIKRFDNISSWWKPLPTDNIETCWANPHGFLKWDFPNPYPEKELNLLKITITSQSLIVICALSKVISLNSKIPKIEVEEFAKLFKKELLKYLTPNSVEEIDKICFEKYRKKKSLLDNNFLVSF